MHSGSCSHATPNVATSLFIVYQVQVKNNMVSEIIVHYQIAKMSLQKYRFVIIYEINKR